MKTRAIVPLAAAAFVATLYFVGGNIVSADPATKDKAAAIVTALYFASDYVFAEPVSKGDAVAMAQKAVAAIKSEGAEKAYAEISGTVRQRRPLHRGRRV